jgi:hypothetical protein
MGSTGAAQPGNDILAATLFGIAKDAINSLRIAGYDVPGILAQLAAAMNPAAATQAPQGGAPDLGGWQQQPQPVSLYQESAPPALLYGLNRGVQV